MYGCAPADGVLGAVLGIKRLDDDHDDKQSDHGGPLFALRSHVLMEPREERRIEAEG